MRGPLSVHGPCWHEAFHRVSHDVIVELIGATTTGSGLRVRAELIGAEPLGVKVSKPELVAVPLRRHDGHGNGTTPSSAPVHSHTRPTRQPQPPHLQLPRRNLDAGLAGGRLRRSGTVRISSYFRSL
jgi:hypothetical protein